MNRIRVAIVTNIPAPYREKVYEIVSKEPNIDLKVFYCKEIESDRKWKIEKPKYNHTYLRSFTINRGEMHLHFNFTIIKELKKFNPDIVVTNGFALPMLLAFFYAHSKKKIHGSFIDGTIQTEKKLTYLHKLLRKYIFARSQFFLGPSNATIQLFKSYDIEEEKIYKSCLAIDNEKFSSKRKKFNYKEFDLLFSGQFIDRKCPFFFAEIVHLLSRVRKNLKVAVIGSGLLEKQFLSKLKECEAKTTYLGFIDQKDLPSVYSNAKILCMPTKEDCWGVVANEAMASGSPVITTPYAGIANELVIDNKTGYVLELKPEEWVEKINFILDNEQLYNKMSENGIKLAKKYTYIDAANGIINSINENQKR